jgi:uncharacterized protein YqfB (UPF0267 family)
LALRVAHQQDRQKICQADVLAVCAIIYILQQLAAEQDSETLYVNQYGITLAVIVYV